MNISDKKISKRIDKYVVMFLLSITIFQQMPVIKDIYYEQIKMTLYILFFIMTVRSLYFIKNKRRPQMIKMFIYTSIGLLFFSVTVSLFFYKNINIMEILIPLSFVIIGFSLRISSGDFNDILYFYIALSSILGLSTIFYYGEGFTISKNYFLIEKNQIGTLLCLSTIISGIWILQKKKFKNSYMSILNYTFFISLISSIIVIRNRSGLMGVIVTLSSYIIFTSTKKITVNKLFWYIVLMFSILLMVNLGIIQSIFGVIYRSLFDNYNIMDLNSISAGRTDIYVESVKFISESPFFGGLMHTIPFVATPHNYILNKLVNYGIIGSFPFLVMYLYLWVITIKKTLLGNKRYLSYWLLFSSLIISLVEYSFPYGPSVSQIILWIFIGFESNIDFMTNKESRLFNE